MPRLFSRLLRHAAAWILMAWVPIGTHGAASRLPGTLDWRPAENKVSASIDAWPLDRVLETIAAKTRWRVYVEPETAHRVNAKFTNLAPGEALRRLLGSLSFVLVPASAGKGSPELYVFRDSREAATRLIEAPAGRGLRGRRLDDELILRLKPGGEEKIEDIAKRLGATIAGRSDELGAYRLKFENAAAAEAARGQLAGEDGTRGLDSNYLVERPDSIGAELPAGLGGLNLKAKPLGQADGVIVAVVDTTVQGEAAGLKDFLLPEISIAGKANVPADELAHGTSMAATFLRGLSQLSETSDGTTVRVLPVDVYGNNLETTSFDIALGIHAAINEGASIVNLSLGGDQGIPFIRELIRAGQQQGVVFLAAAGNEPVTSPTFPAAYPEVIAVTALNRRGEIASYANYGQFVDVGAPGSSYVSFWGQPYMVVGTSPATANASAMAASIAAASGKRGAELEAEVRRALALNPGELAP